MQNQSVSKAVAALILGILGLLAVLGRGILVDFVGIAICIIGLILAISAKKELAAGEGGRGYATAGMVCAIIGLALGALGFLCTACAHLTAFSMFGLPFMFH